MGSAGNQKGRRLLYLPCKILAWLRLLYLKMRRTPPKERFTPRESEREMQEKEKGGWSK